MHYTFCSSTSPFSTPFCVIESKIFLQLKQIRQDMELLRDDKSLLEVSFDSLYYTIIYCMLVNHVSF
jgi:hypothetical protein